MEDSQIIVSDIYKELLSLKERLAENGGISLYISSKTHFHDRN